MKSWLVLYETVRFKIQKKYIYLSSRLRRKGLRNDKFTIISNNCWGGRIYNSYGLQNMSPTIGMVIYPEDYIKFCSNLEEYVNKPLQFISYENSRYYTRLPKDKKYPVACLGDIELHFLHYHSEEEAEEKWKRRVKRICWECLIYKFNDQNGCTKKVIEEFCNLPLKNRLCFVCKKNSTPGALVIKGPFNRNEVKFSYEPYGASRVLNITQYLNKVGK